MMELVKWDPFRRMTHLNHLMDHVLGEFMSPVSSKEHSTREWKPSVDVMETEKGLVIKAELPGVDKEDVGIELKENVLTLKGERKSDNEEKKDGYVRREMFRGSFSRSFLMPAGVKGDDIKAQFNNGILKIEVPLAETAKLKQIPIMEE